MATGLSLVTERAGDGAGEPIFDAENGEELVHVQPCVSIVLANRPPEAPGTLYISTKKVVWLSDADRGKGYAVDFLSVSLHAVSRDREAYPSPCIYTQDSVHGLQAEQFRLYIGYFRYDVECFPSFVVNEVQCRVLVINCKIETGVEEDESECSDSECNGTLDLSKITEMRLVPLDADQLDTLFEIFCECAELNPDAVDEEDGEHNWVFHAENLENECADGEESEWISQNPIHTIGHSDGDHDLVNTVLQLQINDQRFEDAEEMDGD